MGLLSRKKAPKPEEIYEAVKFNRKADVESLLAAKCDPNAFKDEFTGDVCLHLAANKGRTEIIAMLLSGGASANLQNKVRPRAQRPGLRQQGWHPAGPCLRWRPQLRVCCESSIAYASAHAAPLPAARGRPLTRSLAPWQLGQTALHCAAGYGALEVVKVLVDGGADKSITDLDGNTACELAKNYGARSPPALLVFSRVHSPLPRAFGLSGQAEVVNMLS